MTERIRVRAHAKLTLALRVVGRRDDGYHDLDAVVASLDAPADDVAVALRPGPGIGVGVVGPAAAGVPADGSNLAVRAAAAVLRRVGSDIGIAVAIQKVIPAEAGLGGGSADAAAVIDALARLIDDAPTAEDSSRLAAGLGADVPACLTGGLLRMRGTGDVIDPLDFTPGWAAVVAVPPFGLPTADVYRAWDALGGPHSEHIVAPPPALAPVVGELVNDLEPAALAVEPRLERFRDAFAEAVGVPVLLAGSGSAYVAVVDADAGAEMMANEAAAALAEAHLAPRLVTAGRPAARGVEVMDDG